LPPWGLLGDRAHYGLASRAVGNAILILDAAVLVITVLLYLANALTTPGRLRSDPRDVVAAPFLSLAVITPMLLGADGLAPYAHCAGEVVVDVFLVLTVLLGGWFTGQWMNGGLDFDRLHPGCFLPTVAGGLVASATAAEVGQERLDEVMLGLGVICWLVLGSMILGRLFFRPPLPAPLLPTLAIEVAPPAVAALAFFAIDGDRIDLLAAVFAGYGLLMVLAQLRLLSVYAKLCFAPSTWAFTFGWAAVATVTLHWIHDGKPGGEKVWSYLDLAAITVLVGGIAARTMVALIAGNLLPPLPAQPVPVESSQLATP
jgi:tellurite resistance protein